MEVPIRERVPAIPLVEAKPGLRVLFMSGHADESLLRQGAFAAGVGFLGKPFNANGLAQEVRELLDT